MPTSTEWLNLKAGGNWTNWNGPYDSQLKLHAAGAINYWNGTITSRGTWGYYWSATQETLFYGYGVRFNPNEFRLYQYEKEYGLPVRCIRE